MKDETYLFLVSAITSSMHSLYKVKSEVLVAQSCLTLQHHGL